MHRRTLLFPAAAAALALVACAPAATEHPVTTAEASAASECDELARVIGSHDRAIQAISHAEGQGAAHAIETLHRLARQSRETGEALAAVPSSRADLRDARAVYVRGNEEATRALADEAETLRAFAVDAMPLALKLDEAGARLSETCDKDKGRPAAGCATLKKLLDGNTDWNDPAKVADLLDRVQAVDAKNPTVERQKQAFVTRARVVLVRNEEALDDMKKEDARVSAAGDAMRGATQKLAAVCKGGES